MENLSISRNWFTVGLVLLNLALMGFLFFGKKQGPPQPNDIIQLWRHELKLSPEQVAEFREIIGEHRRKTEPLQQAQMENRRALLHAAETPNTDTALVALLTAESGELHRELDEGLVHHYRDLLNVCNPQQQELMKAIFFKTLRQPGGPPPPRRREE
ncbi:MAG: periplasmic heavy metal sensor [Bacteroidetes bacterium]|nr:periplasmic heavy metal sensor [Bacteroidota bacterium]